jgi:hypothetical protein
MHAAPAALPFQSPVANPRFTLIRRDWFGEPLEETPAFRLVLDKDALSLLATARKVPYSAPLAGPGTFYEGLWEHDVAELFLVNPDNGFYWELHVAPSGAWWSCLFDEPRVRAEVSNDPPDGVETDSLEGVKHWETRITVPLASLPAALAFNPARTRGNVCFCLGSAPRQRYASFAAPVPGEPDFHLPDQWLPLRRQRA